MRHDEISPKLYGVETHLKRSKIDSFSFVHCFVLQRRRCGNIYKVIDNHCPGHAPHHQARLSAKSEDWEHVSCLSVELLEWLDREAPRAWHSDRCVMFIPDISLSLLYTTQGHLDCWFLTWPYLAAVWRRHLSPSLLASLSLSLVFSTNHRTVSCRPYWNKHSTSITWLLTGSMEGLTKWATVKRGPERTFLNLP